MANMSKLPEIFIHSDPSPPQAALVNPHPPRLITG